MSKVSKPTDTQPSDESEDYNPFELDNPFEPDKPAAPAPIAPPSKRQLETIMNSYIILAHERMTRVNSREEASAIITEVVSQVREARGGMKVPYDEHEGLVFKIIRKNYGLHT